MSASVTSGQIYELRSIANTEIGIGVASASLSDGANLIRWSAYAGNNDQKWIATDTGSGWTLTNVNSGKLMVVYNANIANGEKVVQWGSGSTNSKWNIAQLNGTDTVTIDGVECPKCASKVIARHGKGRMLFYSCEKYPECDFSTWDMPLREKCPVCNSGLYYRKSRKTVMCKSKDCEYKREEEMAVIE